MQALSFDDLVPQNAAPQGVSFDDLIPKQPPQNGIASSIANSGVGQMVQGGINNAADVMGDVVNPFIGGKYRDQVQTPDLDALRKGGWSGTSTPQKVGAVEEALMTSPPGKVLGILGAAPQAAFMGAGLNTANQAAETNLGIPHQYSQGVEALAAPFLAKPIASMTDAVTNAIQSIPDTMANNSRNLLTNNAGARYGAPLPISDAIKENLLSQNPDVRTYAGEDLAQKISGAEQNAYTNKEQAYQAANPMLSKATIPKNQTADFQSMLKNVAGQYDADLVPAAKSVARYADEFGNEDFNKPTTLEDYETLRQKLNKIPVKDSPTGALVSQAKGALDDHLNDMASKGYMQGDPAVLKTITDARAKNATWRQQFKSTQANSAISNFIDKQGGIDSVAPETLLDQFTKVGQSGFDNVRAAQDVLGTDAAPILKQGYLNKIRQTSVDANGEIVPAKLQTSINSLLQKNPSLSQFVFTPEEIQGLQGISNTAARYAKTGAKPGVLGTVVSNIPIAKHLFAPVIDAAAKARMMKNISNPTQ